MGQLIEIDLDEFLDDDDRREIVRDEFRKAVKARLDAREGFAHSGNHVETFLSNISYKAYWEMIDDIVGDNAETVEQIIKEKVLGHIRRDSNYGIFRDSSWGRSPSKAQQMVDALVHSKRDVIEARVERLLGVFGMDEIRAVLHEQIDVVLRDRGTDDEA
ncbi:MAG: hypothetical protein D3X82_13995 [Candidatus Leucobacter sulfamidivorax]|nr:hypothetical protein [Candidatus Leucobacter sulfamidivorax]